MPRAIAWTCWSSRPSQLRPAWTSASTAPGVSCAFPTRAASRSCAKRLRGLRRLLAGLLPEGLEARLLGEHLLGVVGGRGIEGAVVHLQRALQVADAPV